MASILIISLPTYKHNCDEVLTKKAINKTINDITKMNAMVYDLFLNVSGFYVTRFNLSSGNFGYLFMYYKCTKVESEE